MKKVSPQIEPNLKFKKKTVENRIQFIEFKKKLVPLPTEIEISESGTCNRSCVFCPRSASDFKDIKDFIDPNLVSKIASELNKLNYAGVIRFSGFVEPLLDKKIFNHIKTFKDNCPDSRLELVTNGDVLNLNKLLKLFNNGLDKILISVYDSKEDVIKFENLIKEAKLKKDQFIIRHRYLPPEENFGIILSNRAGLMDKAKFRIPKLENPMEKKCYIPSYTLFFDYLGDVLICPHDWGKKIILGNLKKEKLINIWLKDKAIKIRSTLSQGNRKMSPCNVCDVNGTLMGQINASYF
ncbi:SPASM domain-containing protein [Alphaproteobacteria bacterium]|jgi:radical SAM protein with 4Fe4S-binding SPASM domain|nr:SPASM domain-containing protein [Alphaproteobacteria bacterium]